MLRRVRSFMSMRAAPGDAARIEPELVAPVEVVVDHRRQQVVGRGDGVEIAGEMEVDVLHRRHLGMAAAGGPALHAEAGAERGLAQAIMVFVPSAFSASPRPMVVVVLPSPAGGRADAGDQHQLAARLAAWVSREGRNRSWPCSGRRGSARRPGCRRGRQSRRSAAGSRRARSRGRWPSFISRQAPRAYRPGQSAASRRCNHRGQRRLWAAWQAPASMSAATTRPPAGASAAA